MPTPPFGRLLTAMVTPFRQDHAVDLDRAHRSGQLLRPAAGQGEGEQRDRRGQHRDRAYPGVDVQSDQDQRGGESERPQRCTSTAGERERRPQLQDER